MADAINALNGQGMSLQFEKFAQLAASASKGSSAVRFLGAEAFGAILEDVLSQVENWRQILEGMRGAETAEGEQREESHMLATGGFMQV